MSSAQKNCVKAALKQERKIIRDDFRQKLQPSIVIITPSPASLLEQPTAPSENGIECIWHGMKVTK